MPRVGALHLNPRPRSALLLLRPLKQKLAAVRMLYDFLVVRQITPSNPAHSVRGPKYVVKKGKTPVWSREDAKTLLESIPKDSVSGLRDLALIAAMFYSFARVSAVLKLKVDDYYHNGARRRLRLHEKGAKEHDMPVHHLLEQILNEYIEAALAWKAPGEVPQ
jgi:site-specific recombinase XerD